ncbi:hypothetical protein HY837_04480 [archaeon]|nr:hypothetical protein [archaeon]
MTTIQVSSSTKQTLEWLKKSENLSSYDQVIKKLVDKKTKISKSMFGAFKGIKWEKEDRMSFQDEN